MIRILASLLLIPSFAAAQTCTYRDLIVATAEKVLEIRSELPRLRQRQVGADAVYFLIHYSQMDTEEAISLAGQLREERVRFSEDLAIALAIGRLGVGAGIDRLNIDAAAIVKDYKPAAMRALMLAEGGDLLLSVLGDITGVDRITKFGKLAVLAADQSDEFKEELALRVEAAGFVVFAAYLLSDLQQDTPLREFAQRHKGNLELGFLRATPPFAIGLGYETGAATKELTGQKLDFFDYVRSTKEVAYGPALITYLNRTGRPESALKAADKLFGLLDDEVIEFWEADKAWLAILDVIIEADGIDYVSRMLSILAPPAGRIHAEETSMTAVSDRIRATQSLLPFVQGETDTAPSAPQFMGRIDWNMWQEVAEELRANGLPTQRDDVARLTSAIHLLRAAGRPRDAADLADDLPVSERVLAHQRILRDLDLACDRHGIYSHQNFIATGRILYRFDPIR